MTLDDPWTEEPAEAAFDAPPNLPTYVRDVLEEARAARFETVRRRPLAPGDLPLLSVVRDEAALVGDFLDHHRALGVTRFVMLDNGSVDGTAELLAAEPDVDLHLVRRRFLPQFKQGWLNRAIALYGYDRWYLHADADERLVFDDGGAGLGGLPGLVAYARARGLRRLRGMLVDMYAAHAAAPAPGDGAARPLAERFPLFDADSYVERLCKQRVSRKGGPRQRFFAAYGAAFDPEMTKYPAFHIRAGEVFDNPHHLYPYAENFRSPCHLGVLHYKFAGDFTGKVERALRERSYFAGSAEYAAYRRGLAAGVPLSPVYAGSRRYRGPADLSAAGLIEPARLQARGAAPSVP